MSRGAGRVFRPVWNGRTSQVWWLDYSVRGERHRESSGTPAKREAQRILRERMGGREAGKLVGRPELVTLAILRAGLERHYEQAGNRSLARVKQAFARLEEFLGPQRRALELNEVLASAYIAHRLAQDAARASVRYELAILKASLGVAVKQGLLAFRPAFSLPRVSNARQGFLSDGGFAALLLELPPVLRDVVRFARITGWRVRSEILRLSWDAVDWEAKTVRLWASQTKGEDARVFPFSPDLEEILNARWAVRDGVLVFHRKGKPIRDYRKAWTRARDKAGLGDARPHDIRRTAARDFRSAGVAEGVIMKLCGWKTRSMFDRYAIVSEQDLADAVALRSGKRAASTTPPATDSADVTSGATSTSR